MIESDDWGLCAWSPDEQAQRVLSSSPTFRTEAGRRYGGSTLEGPHHVAQLCAALMEYRGGDGFSPVWQANTIVAAPDFGRLSPPLFEVPALPLADPADASPRWRRPGLWDEVARWVDAGVWWPELHGLHHLPEHAWLTALRRGADDARRALEQHTPVCLAVEASGEYDPSEPRELRTRNLAAAVERFTQRFGRAPRSLCPPDYRWDDSLEADAEALGVTTLQGFAERHGEPLAWLRRLSLHYRWPHQRGDRFYLPPRIAFEPGAVGPDETPALCETVRRAVRSAWGRAQPAVVSTHRANYVQLHPGRCESGLAALRQLLGGLVEDGAVFLVDAEVRQLVERGWSVREVGQRGAIIRYYGVPRETFYVPAPAAATSVRIREGAGGGDVAIEEGRVRARLNVGEYFLEWGPAEPTQ